MGGLSLSVILQVVELLLASGADPTLKDKEGHTAEDFDFKPRPKEGEEGAPAKGDSSKSEL